MPHETATERILSALREHGLKIRQSGGQWAAQCPAHEDRNPSLSVRQVEGMALVYCQAHCALTDVLSALNMTERDLYDNPRGDELARYQYTDASGQPTRTVHRYGGKRFTQSGDKRLSQLYRLPQVVSAVSDGRPVYLVEGEKDVHAIESLGEVATTAPQGASNFAKVDVSPLRGAHVVAVVDRDAAGEKWAAQVRKRLDGYAASLDLVEAAEGKDAADHIASGHTLDDLRPVEMPADPDWSDPLPLNWHTDLPPFPVDALPPTLARFVHGLSVELQTPADLPGTVVLGVLAAAVGGKLVVQVRRNWREPTNLFTVPVLPPGSRKSAVVSACAHPLTDAESTLAEEAAPVILDKRTEREIRDQYADSLKRAAAKDGDPEKIMEAQEAVRRAEQVEVPVWPRLTTNDATPEALIGLLASQGGRIAAISAEAGIFASLTGRYSKTPNLDPVLMAHAGDTILVDRKGRPAERVDSPALTIVASIQPFALRELVTRPDFGGRGVLARILWALPVDNTGSRDVDPPEMPEEDWAAYRALVYELALQMARLDGVAHLTLTEQARKVHLEYHRGVEKRLRRGAALGADRIREWGSKAAGAVARIAGCLHAATASPAPIEEPISEATMRSAIALGDYYEAHAIAAFEGGDDPANGPARTLIEYLVQHGLRQFTQRDISRKGPKTLRKASEMRPALETLTVLGWIREHPDGGYEVHPRAAALLKAGDKGDGATGGPPTAQPPAAVAPVASLGDGRGDVEQGAVSSERLARVAPVARVAPESWAERNLQGGKSITDHSEDQQLEWSA